jgi:thiosulfate dehydrogenase (quinone) large subunit
MAGWALLPLRAFLAVTFCFAGLQKLANPTFFNPNSPAGIQAQLIASERSSPLHALLGHLLPLAVPLGVLIALGELAVGIGALLGLWTRWAALGGMALSLTLFLTVSFHSSPYYTGADIVFLFAWTPLLFAGSGGVLSLDAPPVKVPVRFSVVQSVCGQYQDGRCAARNGAACGPQACPFLLQRVPRNRARAYDAQRRSVVLGGVAAVGALVLAGLTAGVGRLAGGAKAPAGGTTTLGAAQRSSSTTTPAPGATTTAPPAGGASPSTTTGAPTTTTVPGTAIGPAGDVPVGGAARFTDPGSGDPGLVLQLTQGSFVAYDAVCPHAGCTVGYSSAARIIVCPCHGSEFDPSTGAVLVGPSPRGLGTIQVTEGGDGQLYVKP